jgi:hypothetical protein
MASSIVREMLRLPHFPDFINTIILICMPVIFHKFSVELQEAHMHSRLAVVYTLFEVALLIH